MSDLVAELLATFTPETTGTVVIVYQVQPLIQRVVVRLQELERQNARLETQVTLACEIQVRGEARIEPLEREVARLLEATAIQQQTAVGLRQRADELEREVARLKGSEPHVIGMDAPTPENDPAGRFRDLSNFAAQIVDEPTRLCATCQHPAKNHTLGRCRKKRCGCGGWRG